MNKKTLFLLLISILVCTFPAHAQVQPTTSFVSLQTALSDDGRTAHKAPDAARLQSDLDRLVGAYKRGGQVALEQAAGERNVSLRDGRVLVVVEGDVAQLPPALARLGGEIDSVARDRLSLWAPAGALREMAALDGVRYVRLPLPAVAHQLPQAGSYTSEGLALLNADTWQAQGYTGTGVKAAVIDFGFYDWTGLQASGDLPPGTQTICRDLSGGTDCGNLRPQNAHGSACAEILYDVAPGIDTLYLYTFDDDADLGAIVDDMIANGVQVASMSIGWANGEPYDGNGPISAEVNRAREEGGIFWAVAAGNGRQRHWEGTFVDTLGDSWHEFEPGANELNFLAYDGSVQKIAGEFVATLSWNDWPTTDQDYDLYLLQQKGNDWQLYTASDRLQDGDDPPTELIYVANLPKARYALAIHAWNQTGPAEYLELATFYHDQDSRYRVDSSSIMEPATATGAVTVAAYPWTDPLNLEGFSAMGPRNPAGGGAFDPDACGAEPSDECKPDFAGPDWVSTVSAGSEAFGGTSAAAPHIAGAAALLKSAYPSWSVSQIYDYLKSVAPGPGILSSHKQKDWGWGNTTLGDPPAATAVDMVRFEATPQDSAVQIEWETASEIDLLGFSLARSDTPAGDYLPLHESLIPGQGPGSPAGSVYTWLDTGVQPGETYYYRLESVGVDGHRQTYGPVEATAAAPALHRVYLPLISH